LRRPYSDPGSLPSLVQYDPSFGQLVGSIDRPSKLSLLVQSDNPFFHEACVYIPRYDELYITSTLLEATKSSKMASILISRIKLQRSSSDGDNHVTGVEWAKMRPPPGIDMPNGGVNYFDDSVLFCAQGSLAPGTGGIYHMPRSSAAPEPLVTNFHGRDFNSPNDVVVDRSGGVWFTDPCYGYEQEFRKRPKLPNQVYRFDPESGDCRVVADGFERPNGICFAPGEDVVYITDTGAIHGDGGLDATR
jgi:gluconolactonase